jgi:L-lactate utilization protein LutB
MNQDKELLSTIHALQKELQQEKENRAYMQKDMDELRSALLQSEQVKQNLIDQLEKKVDLILKLIQKGDA